MGLLQPEDPPGSDYLEFARFLKVFNGIQQLDIKGVTFIQVMEEFVDPIYFACDTYMYMYIVIVLCKDCTFIVYCEKCILLLFLWCKERSNKNWCQQSYTCPWQNIALQRNI